VRAHGGSSPTHIQNRIQHLENLILSFAQKKKLEEEAPSQTPPSENHNGTIADPKSYLQAEDHAGAVPEERKMLEDSPGKLLVEDVGTSYVDAAHWRAILEDVCAIPLPANDMVLTFARSKK
jgi:hypothetical protein